jgi:hypothetical protein
MPHPSPGPPPSRWTPGAHPSARTASGRRTAAPLRPEDHRLLRRLAAASRARPAQVPGPQVRPHGGVRVAGLLDDVLGSLRPQPPPRPDLAVGVLTQREGPRHILLEGDFTRPSGCLVAGAQGRFERRRLHGRRQQPDLHHQLHDHRRYTHERHPTARSPPITRPSEQTLETRRAQCPPGRSRRRPRAGHATPVRRSGCGDMARPAAEVWGGTAGRGSRHESVGAVAPFLVPSGEVAQQPKSIRSKVA